MTSSVLCPLFLSTRKGTFLQTSRVHTLSTLRTDLPDSYVRCGGDQFRPVPVFTLHAMDDRGGNLRALSAFENFEYTPSVDADGRILHCRWDYIDRFNGYFFSLWSSHQDGTSPRLVYGNYTKRPQATLEPRSIGSWPLRFDRLVQPVLDRHCVTCHHADQEATALVLTADRAWENLINYADRDLYKLVFERDASDAGEGPALKSKLFSYLSQHREHQAICLSPDDWERLYTWMDTYGHIQGSFSPEQDQQLLALRDQYRFLFAPSDGP